MQDTDVIITPSLPDNDFRRLLEKLIRYAVISIPFTVNRMNINDLEQRIINIAKGKLAEVLFFEFCDKNKIPISRAECDTAFWLPDNRDFVMGGYEWDIKNNFLYHRGDVMAEIDYLKLPALVPNRFAGDQWSRRLQVKLKTKGSRYLFTYMKNLDSYSRGRNFLNLLLTEEQQEFITGYYREYSGSFPNKEPFSENDFWLNFSLACNYKPLLFSVVHQPRLVITAYAGHSHWRLFKSCNARSYHGGVIRTRIKNMECEIAELPSFKSFLNLTEA